MASPTVSLFSQDLLVFVERVWAANGRQEIQNARQVYGLYGESNSRQAEATWDLAQQYAQALLDLKQIGGANCRYPGRPTKAEETTAGCATR